MSAIGRFLPLVKGSNPLWQTARVVLVSLDSECSQHATAYEKPFWLIVYTVFSVNFRGRGSVGY